PRFDHTDVRTEQLHPEDVEALPAHVLRSHEDLASQAEQGGDGRGGYAVLARARLRDHPRLLEPAGHQRLPDRVVDLVGASMQEVLALEEDARAAETRREIAREVEARRPPGVVLEPAAELLPKRRVATQPHPGAFEIEELRHERLGDVPATVDPEMPA